MVTENKYDGAKRIRGKEKTQWDDHGVPLKCFWTGIEVQGWVEHGLGEGERNIAVDGDRSSFFYFF